MFTVVAWDESQDTSNALTAVAAVADPHVRVSGDDIIVPDEVSQLLGVYAIGDTITRAQLVAPSLRRFSNHEVIPLDDSALPTNPLPIDLFPETPIRLTPDEALNAQVAENAAGAEREIVIAFLCDGPITPRRAEHRTVQATGSTALVANAWTNCAVTFRDQLPAGLYEIIGFRARSTNLIAARLVLPGYMWRPGVIGEQDVVGVGSPFFRHGNLGVWGTFRHNTPPTVDCLATGADAAETFEFDLVQVG